MSARAGRRMSHTDRHAHQKNVEGSDHESRAGNHSWNLAIPQDDRSVRPSVPRALRCGSDPPYVARRNFEGPWVTHIWRLHPPGRLGAVDSEEHGPSVSRHRSDSASPGTQVLSKLRLLSVKVVHSLERPGGEHRSPGNSTRHQ